VPQEFQLSEALRSFLLYQEERPFNFVAAEFWVFLAVFLVFFSLVYNSRRWKNPVIFLFSAFFYYKSSEKAVVLLIYAITQDFILAGFIDRSGSWKKKAWLTLSIISNLLILAYFKYAYLLVDLWNQATGAHIEKQNWLALLVPGRDLLQLDVEHILLPAGISFFLFHSLSYTIDVYRGLVKPIRNWFDYAVFVSFFPELVAGPIVRARDFVDQLQAPFQGNSRDFGKGLALILVGLFKKIVVSDVLSTQLVDKVFDFPHLASSPETWMAMYGYGIQIFCDFSGYTDIAIGLALILGYHLKPNFDEPYKSTTITEFWRRWHISLSVWLRDYLYIPLGGNRHGKVRTYLNLLVTMLLGGLWHGASWKFLAWGGFHGLALALHKGWMEIGKGKRKLPGWISWFLTLHFVLFCWIPFRAGNWQQSLEVIQHLWLPIDPAILPEMVIQYSLPLSMLVLGFVIQFFPGRWKTALFEFSSNQPTWRLAMACIFWLVLLYQFKTAESKPFIYFQF
jgi:alginate O-acetyltransferase complex protein AlgI